MAGSWQEAPEDAAGGVGPGQGAIAVHYCCWPTSSSRRVSTCLPITAIVRHQPSVAWEMLREIRATAIGIAPRPNFSRSSDQRRHWKLTALESHRARGDPSLRLANSHTTIRRRAFASPHNVPEDTEGCGVMEGLIRIPPECGALFRVDNEERCLLPRMCKLWLSDDNWTSV